MNFPSDLQVTTDPLKLEIMKHWDAHPCDFEKGRNWQELDDQRVTAYPYARKELEFEKDKGKTVLEIGVGSGIDACFSFRIGPPKKYILLDISQKALEISSHHLDAHIPNANYECVWRDAADMSCFETGSIDRVKALGSLHHIPNADNTVIPEIGRILKPGGDFIFMLYNKRSLRYYISYAKNFRKIMDVDGPSNPYTKLYSSRDIKQVCKNAGLQVTKVRYYGLLSIERQKLGLVAPLVERWFGFALYVHGVKA